MTSTSTGDFGGHRGLASGDKNDAERLAKRLLERENLQDTQVEDCVCSSISLLAIVAPAVKEDEVRRIPAAQETMGEEWRKLRELKRWDETVLCEYDDVRHRP